MIEKAFWFSHLTYFVHDLDATKALKEPLLGNNGPSLIV